CNLHYRRARDGSDMLAAPRNQYRRTCSIPGCGRRHYGRGLCHTHYQRARDSGALGGRTCSVPGCGKPMAARGHCWMHYQRLRSTGDPAAVKRVACCPEGTERWSPSNGVVVKKDGRWVSKTSLLFKMIGETGWFRSYFLDGDSSNVRLGNVLFEQP